VTAIKIVLVPFFVSADASFDDLSQRTKTLQTRLNKYIWGRFELRN
jgi:hypothetical protein